MSPSFNGPFLEHGLQKWSPRPPAPDQGPVLPPQNSVMGIESVPKKHLVSNFSSFPRINHKDLEGSTLGQLLSSKGSHLREEGSLGKMRLFAEE